MTDRNVACKTCGTKVFKIQEEADTHHKESHQEVESKIVTESSDQENQDSQ